MNDRRLGKTATSLAVVLALAAFGQIGLAQAGTLFPIKYKCPVGGKQFVANVRAAWTSFGARPDGKAYNNYISPQPIIECPDNKLLMYRDFSKEEVKRLAALIASDEYRAIRKKETSYYAANWLARKMQDSPLTQFAFLQKAKWQADTEERLTRYTREMLAAIPPALAAQEYGSDIWWQLSWQQVNAHRELGDFAAARSQLEILPVEQLNMAIPDKQFGNPAIIEEKVRPFPGAPEVTQKRENILNAKEIERAQADLHLYRSFQKMAVLIAEGNRNSEPVTLIPEREKIRRCKWFADALTPSEIAVCDSVEIKKQVEKFNGPKESNYD